MVGLNPQKGEEFSASNTVKAEFGQSNLGHFGHRILANPILANPILANPFSCVVLWLVLVWVSVLCCLFFYWCVLLCGLCCVVRVVCVVWFVWLCGCGGCGGCGADKMLMSDLLHLIRVAEHLGASSRRPRHPALNVQVDGVRKRPVNGRKTSSSPPLP